MSLNVSHQMVLEIVEAIVPFDAMEKEHRRDAIEWIVSGVEIFRVQKPATPPKHLVSYFVVIDSQKRKLLLVDHIKAQCWLPAGGHVDLNEHPRATVAREIQEELNMSAMFLKNEPVLFTETVTYGLTPGHMDVTFWYAVAGDATKKVVYDHREFNACQWFDYEELLQMDITKLDPHMHRFVKKWLQDSVQCEVRSSK